ncbi:hypothetical protein [Streptomyces sp. NPDC047028]|uniref:hypothetical protein n=1 Tax=Streptomyces sp. NPDC047028 TaxID=3155793 RepID=UPI0033C2DB17
MTSAPFNTPTAAVAYAGAPSLRHEAESLLRQAAALAAAPGDPAVTEDDRAHVERLYLLGRAALADREALEQPTVERLAVEAEALARQLLDLDRQDPEHTAGTHPPDHPGWAGAERVYVRQEYDAWGW